MSFALSRATENGPRNGAPHDLPARHPPAYHGARNCRGDAPTAPAFSFQGDTMTINSRTKGSAFERQISAQLHGLTGG